MCGNIFGIMSLISLHIWLQERWKRNLLLEGEWGFGEKILDMQQCGWSCHSIYQTSYIWSQKSRLKAEVEGSRSEEGMGNVVHERASSSARSLPVCPICAFIQEIVRQRRYWLSVLSVRMVSFTGCEVTQVLCKAKSVKIFANLSVGRRRWGSTWATIWMAVTSTWNTVVRGGICQALQL